MIDSFNYVSSSRVKTLFVPVRSLKQPNFDRYLNTIHKTRHEVRLSDVTPMPELAYFNPQTFPKGHVMFEVVTSAPDSESIFLHDFEPSRKTFIVVGIGSYNENDSEEDKRTTLNELKNKYPGTIVQNIIFFDTPENKLSNLNPASDHSRRSIFYYGDDDSRSTYSIESIMSDMTKNFLFELDNYALSYSNITLRSPMSITNSNMISKTIVQAQKRLSSGSSSFKVSFSNNGSSNTLDSKSKVQQRFIGRKNKLLGNFHLLAGKYLEALNLFTEALTSLKKSDDYLWLGSTLDGITVALILLQFSGVPYQLPGQALINALNIPKSKLQTINSPPLSEGSSKRTSHEATNVQSGAHLTVQSNTSGRKSSASPRNSTSSFMSFGFSNQVSNNSDLASLALPELVKLVASRILYYYDISTNDFENLVPDTVYVEFILRNIRFMINIHHNYTSFPWCIVKCGPFSNHIDNGVNLESSPFSKTEIIREIDKVYSLNIATMSIFDQCRIHCALASMYSELGLLRKKALVLRMLLSSLLPKLESTKKTNQVTFKDIDGGKNFMRFEDDDNISSILDIIEFLFNIYLVDIETESSAKAAAINSKGTWISLQIKLLRLCLKIAESTQSYEFLMKVCTLLLTRYTHCLPPDDQIKVRDKIEWLIAISHTNNFSLSAPYWDPFLLRNISFIGHKGKHELVPFKEYAKGATNLDLMNLTDEKLPNGQGNISTYNEVFNPYNKSKNTGIDKSRILIKGEPYQLTVTLQNPFFFPIEISDLNIETEGAVEVQTLKHTIRLLSSSIFHANTPKANGRPNNLPTNQKRTISTVGVGNQMPTSSNALHSLTIDPQSINQFIVGFIPLSLGILNISGLEIKVLNCNKQFFRIVLDELLDDFSKVKNIGTSHRASQNTLETLQHNLNENNITSRVSTSNLTLSVVPSQPALTLTGSLISNGWIMLLEGEVFPFSLSFRNNSDVTINYLSFSFWDSTIDQLSSKLNSNLPAPEVHEIEWMLLKSRPFQIRNKKVISETFKTMEPRKNLDMYLDIIGKKDMKQLKVVLEYSHKIANDITGSYVKSFEVPINVSVVPSIEVISYEFSPLISTIHNMHIDMTAHKNIRKISNFIHNQKNIDDYCLMIVDLVNHWKEKLQCNFKVKNCDFVIDEIIDVGKTVRILLPIKKVLECETDLTRHVPSLRNKQFIKNYQISESDELAMKKQFWLRENILENLEALWKTCYGEDTNNRYGNINIRMLRLTNKMVETILYPNVKLLHVIIDDETNQPVKKSGAEYIINSESFYTLKVTIKNHSNKDIQGFLRHLPVLKTGTTNVRNKTLVSLDRKILINGILQKHIDGAIKPQESYEESLSFVVLDRGHYEWVTILDVLNQDIKVVDREPIQITVL